MARRERWVYTDPRMEMVEVLVRRHVGKMKGRDVANTLWAYAAFRRTPLRDIAVALELAVLREVQP